MRKLHFGSGGRAIGGWESYDMDVDLTKPLPFPDQSADYIFCEHCIEHLTPAEVWSYFEECFRILRQGGVVRTTFPCVARTMRKITQSYRDFVRAQGWGDGSFKDGIRHLVVLHGHQSVWHARLITAILKAIGFSDAVTVKVGKSKDHELRGIEQHWRAIGIENNNIESVSVEAVK